MKQCKRCGIKVKDEVLDCPRCGSKEFSGRQEVKENKEVEKTKRHIESVQTAVKLTKRQEAEKDKAMMIEMKRASSEGIAFNIQRFEREWIQRNVIDKQKESNATVNDNVDKSIVSWFITLFLLCIPVFNIWICIKGFNSTEKNFYKAFICYYIIMIVVGILIRILI